MDVLYVQALVMAAVAVALLQLLKVYPRHIVMALPKLTRGAN